MLYSSAKSPASPVITLGNSKGLGPSSCPASCGIDTMGSAGAYLVMDFAILRTSSSGRFGTHRDRFTSARIGYISASPNPMRRFAPAIRMSVGRRCPTVRASLTGSLRRCSGLPMTFSASACAEATVSSEARRAEARTSSWSGYTSRPFSGFRNAVRPLATSAPNRGSHT